MFKYPLQPDTMWSTLNDYSQDVDWSYSSGAIDETEYVDVIASLMDADQVEKLSIDQEVYPDDEEILDAGFNESFRDRMYGH